MQLSNGNRLLCRCGSDRLQPRRLTAHHRESGKKMITITITDGRTHTSQTDMTGARSGGSGWSLGFNCHSCGNRELLVVGVDKSTMVQWLAD